MQMAADGGRTGCNQISYGSRVASSNSSGSSSAAGQLRGIQYLPEKPFEQIIHKIPLHMAVLLALTCKKLWSQIPKSVLSKLKTRQVEKAYFIQFWKRICHGISCARSVRFCTGGCRMRSKI